MAAGVVRLGLTGGIGSGKSTVGAMLRDRGAALIDADAIARRVTAPGGAAIDAIARAFGPSFIDSDGALDRAAMRQLVYVEPQARQRLEAIVHPLVGEETRRETDAAIRQGTRCLVHDIPLLVESGRWRAQLDRVLVVDCEPVTQIHRVMARNGLARDEVERIITAQASRAQRLDAADWVIFNDGLDLPGLAAEVDQLAVCLGL